MATVNRQIEAQWSLGQRFTFHGGPNDGQSIVFNPRDAQTEVLIGADRYILRRHDALLLFSPLPVAAGSRYAMVFCSQCGKGFGPGDHGFSHCCNHAGMPVVLIRSWLSCQ